MGRASVIVSVTLQILASKTCVPKDAHYIDECFLASLPGGSVAHGGMGLEGASKQRQRASSN